MLEHSLADITHSYQWQQKEAYSVEQRVPLQGERRRVMLQRLLSLRCKSVVWD